jgi:hypothetical protein
VRRKFTIPNSLLRKFGKWMESLGTGIIGNFYLSHTNSKNLTNNKGKSKIKENVIWMENQPNQPN